MARPNRGTVYAGIYHVWRRTPGGAKMFRDDTDCTDFCRRLAATIELYHWVCMSFVLMPTHFHLVLEVEEDALQPGMHRLFGGYAQQFNLRWGRNGHLKGGPYKCRPIDGETDLLGVVRYVARNPVRDGLCAKPQDWYWSSYAGTAGYSKPFPFVDDTTVLGLLDDDREGASRLLRVIVETE